MIKTDSQVVRAWSALDRGQRGGEAIVTYQAVKTLLHSVAGLARLCDGGGQHAGQGEAAERRKGGHHSRRPSTPDRASGTSWLLVMLGQGNLLAAPLSGGRPFGPFSIRGTGLRNDPGSGPNRGGASPTR